MGTNDATPVDSDKAQEKERSAAKRQLLISYRMAFTGSHGERVLEDLKRQMFYGVPAYQPGMNAEDAFFRSGNQDSIAYILMMLEKDPEEFS